MRTVLLLVVVLMTTCAHASEHQKWNSFLSSHVKDGLVDYKSAGRDDSLLRSYLQQLAGTDFHNLSRMEKLAYLINGYNAYTVALILDHAHEGVMVDSIKDIGGFFSSPWKQKSALLGGTLYTLDEIEHKLIRAQFSDPRVHFALNCASISCPPLAPFAYEGKLLDTQLNSQTKSFINKKENTYRKGNRLHISKIFDWYEDDFTSGVLVFIKKYAEGELATQISGTKELSLSYQPYDWSLNIVKE